MNMGTQELGPPWYLGQIFLGTQTKMSFFYWSQKVLPVCWGFNYYWSTPIADRDKDFGGLLGHLSIN